MSDALPMIVADVGNSALKLATVLVDAQGAIRLDRTLRLPHGEIDKAALDAWVPQEACQWHVASVHEGKLLSLFEWISAHRPHHRAKQLIYLDLSLAIAVEEPFRVGIDRLLSVVAANQRRPAGRPALTITAGTAITLNVIDAQGAFLGGAILPSWRMASQALHDYTDALPLVGEFAPVIKPIGKNTRAAIRSGLYWGLKGAVSELIAQFQLELDDEVSEFFIAGGDAQAVRTALGRGVLAPDLVLEGAAIVGVRGVSQI